MKILLVQIGDIHLDESECPQDRVVGVSRAVASLDAQAEACLVVLAGDIAFSGKKEQYERALSFLTALEDELTQAHVGSLFWAAVPGNHDCDFERDTEARQLVVSRLRGSALDKVDASTVELCTAPQTAFFDFVSGIEEMDTRGHTARLSWDVWLQVGDMKLLVRCLNTAWMSELNEDQGGLLFPVGNVPPVPGDASLVVTVLHHPYNWFDFRNARRLMDCVSAGEGIVLTGHEHRSDSSSVARDGEPLETYIAGAVLCERGGPANSGSGFNVVEVDTELSQRRVVQFEWAEAWARYSPKVNGPWCPYVSDAAVRHSAPWSHVFAAYLDDPGAGFTHPQVDDLHLQDILILPDLVERLNAKSKESDHSKLIESDQVLEYIYRSEHVVISAPDLAGKSTLLKRVILDLAGRGIVPVLLDGRKLETPSRKGLRDLVEAALQSQRRADECADYWQLPRTQRALLIDDFGLAPMNSRGREELIGDGVELFQYVIVAGDETLQYDEVLDGRDGSPFWAFNHCTIPEMGRRLRERLIRRWLLLGREWQLSDADLVHEIAECETLVDTLLGKQLMPAYPMIILLLLQNRDAAVPLNTASGALGYYYEMLITTALDEVTPPAEMDARYTYLAELANCMYEAGTRDLAGGAVIVFNRQHYADYRLSVDYEALREDLVRVRILQQRPGGLRFRYAYIYYYFVARYIRDARNDAKQSGAMHARVQTMARNVHREVNANTLIFLCYLTRDPAVVNEILGMARATLARYAACDLDKDVKTFAFLQVDEPQVCLPGTAVEEARDEHLKEIDRVERDGEARSAPESTEELQDGDGDRNLVEINAALKTIQILGQILRNFPGSTRADRKLEIAEECYSLGLRTMSMFLHAAGAALPQLTATVRDYIKDASGESDETKLTRSAERILFFLVEGVIFGLIKRVSRSTGSEQLGSTYDDLEEKWATVAVDMINIAIKLDHYRSVPHEEIIGLHQAVRDNVFSSTLLRHLVVEHLRLFHVPSKVRQRLCSKLGIKQSAGALSPPA